MLTFHSKQRFGTRALASLPPALKLDPQRPPRTLLDYRVDPRGMFASRKMEAMVPWGERLERDLMFLLEADQRVVSYERRPSSESAEISIEGKLRTYVPNLRVLGDDKRVALVAACAQDQLVHPLHSAILAELQSIYEQRGQNFHVVESARVHEEPRFSNSKAVVSARHISISAEWRFLLAEFFPTGKCRTLAEIEQLFGGGPSARESVLALVAEGMLALDMAAPIVPGTPIALRWAGGAHG